jgi:hypothetical protein
MFVAAARAAATLAARRAADAALLASEPGALLVLSCAMGNVSMFTPTGASES